MNVIDSRRVLPQIGGLPLSYWFVFSCGLIWAVHLSLKSTGALTDDEIGHFLLSRSAFQYPDNLLDMWGRPVNTFVYALAAQGGLTAARLFSVLLSAITVLLATRLGSLLGVQRPFLIAAFLWFQPWFGDAGHAVLTEVPFSLWLTAGTLLWASGRYTFASVFAGLLALTRHEGIALTGTWILYMLTKQQFRAAIAAALPLVLFNAVAFGAEGATRYAIYFHPQPTTFYGHGDWLHFVRTLRSDVGAPILLLSTIGLWPFLFLRGSRRFAIGFLMYFAIHVVIFRFGLFASGGYSFFLLPLAPMFAVAAALGTESLLRVISGMRLLAASWRLTSLLRPETAAATVVVATMAYCVRIPPRPLEAEGVALKQAAEFLARGGYSARPTVSTNVNFYYFHGLPVGPQNHWWEIPPPGRMPVGTIAVWDRHYSERFGLRLAGLLEGDCCWRRLASFGRDDFAIVFEKTTSTRPPGLLSIGHPVEPSTGSLDASK